MLNDFWAALVYYGITLFGFWIIGAAALEYRVARYKPSDVVLESFLRELNFPLNRLYYNSRYNIFLAKGHKSSVEYLQKTQNRFLSLLALFLLIVSFWGFWVFIWTLSIIQGHNNIIRSGWLLSEIVFLVLACSFGRKLPIMIRLAQAEAEQVTITQGVNNAV